MFIVINNSEMNVPQVLNWINRTKNANNNIISPEFAMDILSKTNFYGHIKAVLKNIKENCKTKEDILTYKEFILSCVDRRETSAQAMADLQELADLCDIRDEFDRINNENKLYDKKACEKLICVTTGEALDVKRRVSGDDLEVLFYQVKEDEYDVEDIRNIDLAGIKKLRFNYGDRVAIDGVDNVPKILDFSNCTSASINMTDIKNVEEIKWANLTSLNSCHVYLDKVDFSDCAQISLEHVDFYGDELKLGGVCDLDFINFPKKLDLSECKAIYSEFVLGANNVEEIKFKNREQKQNLMERIGSFNGKFVYEEEEVGLGDKLKKFLGRDI